LANASGATAIEYGLVAALIALAIIGGLTALGTNISTPFEDAAAGL
jgi:pilus assembly protein Flp/PilA